ncbi:MAG: TolC family protein [Planctomycetota bacterium]
MNSQSKPVAKRSNNQWHPLILWACLCCLSVAAVGCSRAAYRQRADRDAYQLIFSRQVDPRWHIPARTVEPDPTSRMADIACPDCGPLPPDDPAASDYMVQPYGTRRPIDYWAKRGILPAVDNEQWIQYLPTDEEGKIKIDKQTAVELSLIHNREFQSQVEQLHIQAIGLSANRFEYEANWFAGSGSSFAASGDGAAAARDLGGNSRVGFSRNFASGGQFLTNIINSFTWQLGGGPNTNFATGGMLFQLTQPLLRGAYRYVRTEALTQSERSLLYSVRSFARFRRQFYFDIVQQYLGLVNQVESVAINRENLRNLQLNLDEHNILFDQGKVSPIQVDQVIQQLQSGQLSVINSEQALQASFDQFKFTLGLPAKVEIDIDQSLVDQFQLNSPELTDLQNRALELGKELAEFLPPEEASPEFLDQIYQKVRSFSEELEEQQVLVQKEFEAWSSSLETEPKGLLEAEVQDREQQKKLALRNREDLDELDEQIKTNKKRLAQGLGELKLEDLRPELVEDEQMSPAVERWQILQLLISQRGGLKDRINTLFVSQAQIRLFSIEIQRVNIPRQFAVELALENRLDLMNSRAQVVDAYRSVELAANRLQSDLSLTASANLNSDPNVDNAFRIDGENSQYNLGLAFDGPVNRFGERNSYRNAQIGYQQTRRSYMQAEDALVNGIRQNLRQLQTNRYNFLISRQQLITATRQLDQSQFNLRTATSGDSSLTQDVLRALTTLRDAKTSLISSWINYETSRISLFVDLELLQLDEQGVWVNEDETFEDAASFIGNDGTSDVPPANDSSNRGNQNVPNSREPANNGDNGPALEAPGESGTGLSSPPTEANLDSLGRPVPDRLGRRRSGLLSAQR